MSARDNTAWAWDGAEDAYEDDPGTGQRPLSVEPNAVEVRRNRSLAVVVGGLASMIAIAYLGRASSTGALLDWVLAIGMAVVGAAYLRSFVDARTPLLVADSRGVRIRLGGSWQGLTWGAIRAVEHQPRRGLLRDGRLALQPHNPDRLLAELDRRGRRHSAVSQRMYGAPFAVPLGLVTRITGADGDLTAALDRLAGDRVAVELIDPVEDRRVDDRAAEDSATELIETDDVTEPAGVTYLIEDRTDERTDGWAEDSDLGDDQAFEDQASGDRAEDDRVEEDPEHGPARRLPDPRPMLARLVASATPSPLRETRVARRTDVRLESPDEVTPLDSADEAAERDEAAPAWSDRVRPIARPGEAVEPLVIDDLAAAEPAEDPVVGPELSAARIRLGLSVDQLAERTRIRPHVIESIEVDDFVPCGGDFYARGHLRTLARVLGVDAEPLLTQYDERYADAPINARRVFEAELATGAGGSIRGTRGGPNWSVLIAAIMTLVLVWSVARLLMDTPVELQQPAPVLNGSAGVGNGNRAATEPVSVSLTSIAGGAEVTVRDGNGEVVFTGDIAHGASESLDAVPPIRVESSDAGAIEIHVAGKNRGTLGESGSPGRGTFIVR